MNKKYLWGSLLLVTLLSACVTKSHTQRKEIEQKISEVIQDKKATVGVAVWADDEIVALHNNEVHYPLLSVFKYHVALAVLNKMDKANTSLDSIVEVKASQLHANTYSPLRQKFPDRDISISLRELLQYSVSQSDNNACDILIDYAGGIGAVNKYIHSLGIADCELAANEDLMHRDTAAVYSNWSTPEAVVRLLHIADKEPLFATPYKDFLQKIMEETSTGPDKLKGLLSSDVTVGHKTGSSDRSPEGVKIADNDAGYVILPDGRKYFIAVFVTQSHETDKENAAIIARISEIVYESLKPRNP